MKSKLLSVKSFKTTQTHFYTGGHYGNQSGIKVCLFGGNSTVGVNLASEFLSMGTPTNMVYRNQYDLEIPTGSQRILPGSNPYNRNISYATNANLINDSLKNVRPFGEIGLKMFTHVPDLTIDWDIENAIKDCDVIINTVGASPVLRYDEDFEEANIIIPRKIAKICAKLKGNPVKRLLHFSANGADPDSMSRNLRTKWIGEQEVREFFPEATIIRPTEILANKMTNNFLG